jgi:hypothetical protein
MTTAVTYGEPMSLRHLFHPLLGNWTGAEEQAASPWAPAGSARAMIVFKLDVQGRVVVQDYRQVRKDGAEFSAHGVFMIIDDASRIGWWLFDSYGEPPEPATGSWLGQKLIMEKTTPGGVARHTFSIEDEKLIYRIELKLVDEPHLRQFLVGAYQRISGH